MGQEVAARGTSMQRGDGALDCNDQPGKDAHALRRYAVSSEQVVRSAVSSSATTCSCGNERGGGEQEQEAGKDHQDTHVVCRYALTLEQVRRSAVSSSATTFSCGNDHRGAEAIRGHAIVGMSTPVQRGDSVRPQ